MYGPFDFVKSINVTKEDLVVDKETERDYNAFLTNRTLSYFQDCVALVNEINMRHGLDNKLQFHFLLNTIRQRKRFAEWIKPKHLDNLDAVQEYYQVSTPKALEMLKILTDDQLVMINKKLKKGGVEND